MSWNPNDATAHYELALRYVDLFEVRQQAADNALGVLQIRDTVEASRFPSPDEMRAWLERAFGNNATLLDRAREHARQAVALCPLEGESYVLLANLCFLDGGQHPSLQQYAAQGLRVRPHSGAVLFELGRQRLVAGEIDVALAIWAKCSNDPGPHQLPIVYTLAGRIPAAMYIEKLRPDWRTLRQIWIRYRQFGQPQGLNDLVTYAAQVTQRQVREKRGIPPAWIWLWQASMYTDLQQSDNALACLEQAYRADPQIYSVRQTLGRSLLAAGRFSEAEPHIRWCLARRPENKSFRTALDEISNQRLAQRAPDQARALSGSLLRNR